MKKSKRTILSASSRNSSTSLYETDEKFNPEKKFITRLRK